MTTGIFHEAYIFDDVNTNQDGPLGIQISKEGLGGNWAWYSSGSQPRFIDSVFQCTAQFWSMLLPHITLISTFQGQQGICEYSGSYTDIANAVGLTSSLTSGSFYFPNTALYAQGSCCNGATCCGCSNCGGQLANTVNVGTTHAIGEVQLMIDHLLDTGKPLTQTQKCGCNCPSQGCFCGLPQNCGCPAQPQNGVSTPQQGRVDLIYGPFNSQAGRYPQNPVGVAPFIQYGLMEQPPPQCTGDALAQGLTSLGSGLVGLLTGGIGGAVASNIIANVGSTLSISFIRC